MVETAGPSCCVNSSLPSHASAGPARALLAARSIVSLLHSRRVASFFPKKAKTYDENGGFDDAIVMNCFRKFTGPNSQNEAELRH
jgi:hypothetical protein